MGKKKIREFLSSVLDYTKTKAFEEMMTDFCREKGIDFNDDFREGSRAGFFLSMCMYSSPKSKKTSEFLKKMVIEMASTENLKLKSN